MRTQEVEEKINRVCGSFAVDGMHLDSEQRDRMRRLLNEEITVEEAISEIHEKLIRGGYGRKTDFLQQEEQKSETPTKPALPAANSSEADGGGKYLIGSIRIPGIAPTACFLEFAEKERLGLATEQDYIDFSPRGYVMSVSEQKERGCAK